MEFPEFRHRGVQHLRRERSIRGRALDADGPEMFLTADPVGLESVVNGRDLQEWNLLRAL